MRIGII